MVLLWSDIAQLLECLGLWLCMSWAELAYQHELTQIAKTQCLDKQAKKMEGWVVKMKSPEMERKGERQTDRDRERKRV